MIWRQNHTRHCKGKTFNWLRTSFKSDCRYILMRAKIHFFVLKVTRLSSCNNETKVHKKLHQSKPPHSERRQLHSQRIEFKKGAMSLATFQLKRLGQAFICDVASAPRERTNRQACCCLLYVYVSRVEPSQTNTTRRIERTPLTSVKTPAI